MHECQILITVGVKVAVFEIDIVIGGEPLHRVGLTRPPQDRRDDFAGQHAVVIDIEPVGQNVGDTEESGHRLHLDRQGRRTQHHGVTAFHVRVHQIAHLRIDPFFDLLGEQSLADLLQIRQRAAAQYLGGLVDQPLELHPAELVVEARGNHIDQLADAHIAVAEPLAGQDHSGESGNQGAVDVKERPDPGSARAGHHLGHRTGKPQLPGTAGGLVAHE